MNFRLIQLWLLLLLGSKSLRASKINCIYQENQTYIESDFSLLRSTFNPFTLYPSVTVKNAQINVIPDYIFANYCIHEINLSNNAIGNVSDFSFYGIIYLRSLILSQNVLESIRELILGLDVNELEYLDLSHNQIKKLDSKFPQNFKSLIKLDLSLNNIEWIDDWALENLNNLKTLTLASNRIKSIRNFSLTGLVNLQQLNLENNLVSQIDTDAFSDLRKLETFKLNQNEITYLGAEFSRLKKLSDLNLASNRITVFPTGVFHQIKSFSTLNLKNCRLDETISFDNLSLKSLYLDSNNISVLNPQVFSKMTDLWWLTLKQAKIQDINKGAFLNLSNVFALDLSYNKIKTLKNRVFQGLSGLLQLRLDYNAISEIEPFAFESLESLNNLYLGHNLLKVVPSDLLRNLNSLDYLELSFNRLTKLEKGFIRDLSSITQIFLDRNSIAEIQKGAIENLTNLKFLDLSYNKLKAFKSDSFIGLTSLLHLYLSGNRINTISKYSFVNLLYIKDLDLRDNYLINIDPKSFVGCKIRRLDLSKNQLDDIDPLVFFNSEIEIVVLSNNQLKTLNEFQFRYLTRLSEVDLSFNKIETISSLVFGHGNSSVESLRLSNNWLKSLDFLRGSQFANLIELDVSFNFIEHFSALDLKSLVNLKIVNIAGNQIKKIDPDAFGSLISLNLSNISYTRSIQVKSDQMHTVDFSHNTNIELQLVNRLTALKKLYLKNVNLNFSTVNLNHLKTLEHLDLSDNRDDGLFTFWDLSLLEWLDLSNMGVSCIRRFNFSNFNNLRELNLSFNLLETVDEGLANLETIRMLDLTNNRIKSMVASSARILESVVNLYLDNNMIETFVLKIHKDFRLVSLSNNSVLKSFQIENEQCNEISINIAKNSLASILVSYILGDFTCIKELIMSDNQFEVIKKDLFANMIILNHLNLESNKISAIDGSAFRTLDQLEKLTISRNFISNLDDHSFKNLIHLKYLNFSFNLIESIASPLFADLYNLEKLDLSFNRIKLVQDFSFTGLESLGELFINDNFESLRFSTHSFDGLKSIANIYMSISTLEDELNKRVLIDSLAPIKEKTVNDVDYYKSINIIYGLKSGQVNCWLTLDFVRKNILVNLKSDTDLIMFVSSCIDLDLFEH